MIHYELNYGTNADNSAKLQQDEKWSLLKMTRPRQLIISWSGVTLLLTRVR